MGQAVFGPVLDLAVRQGFISGDQAESLKREADEQGRAPLALLREWGQVTEEDLVFLEEVLEGAADITTAGLVGAAPEEAATAIGKPVEGKASATDPMPGWRRYRIERLLGRGGMGRVYLAYDPSLRRRVAIKLLHRENPAAVRRFIAEARAQARVNHDRVCRVYEVGEALGRTYIAMQFVDGEPLQRADLGLEEKVLVMKRAAEGVQAAHRAGLIHRDIKPGNIMLERSGEDVLNPYVLDFGLARQWRKDGTLTDSLAGTPNYMAPEQARGELEKLDRRADLYSLGATLYYLLTGTAPATGSNNLEIIRKVIEEEPLAPRKHEAEIPADLEAIVLKCLEKRPSDRYASARALAEDLGRYLDGEPVSAGSRRWFYRARKKLRKHRLLSSLILLCLAVVALAAGLTLQTRYTSARREQLAREFTEKVERVEAQARYIDLSPAHDIRPGLRALRTKMAEIRGVMERAGPLAKGPGHYALGRVFFALGDHEKARIHLETAWDEGFRQPRVAYMLGLVFGAFYQKHRAAAESIAQADLRAARMQEIEIRFRDPAHSWLEKSQGTAAPLPEAYGLALLAYFENRLDDALDGLAEIDPPNPWLHEVARLAGDIFLARAIAAEHRGDREAARTAFERGKEAYRSAIEIGSSVPANYLAQAKLHLTMMKTALYGGGPVHSHFEDGIKVLAHGLAVDPDYFESLTLKATLYWRLAEHRHGKREDVRDALETALTAARAAVSQRPDDGLGLAELGRCHRMQARFLLDRNLDPSEALIAAIAAFERVPEPDRSYLYYLDMGNLYKDRADFAARKGEDPIPFRNQTIASCRRAAAINPDVPDAYINLGIAFYQRSGHHLGLGRVRDLAAGARYLNRALQFNPDHVSAHYTLGQIHRAEAASARADGRDPEPALENALGAFRRAADIDHRNPKVPGEIGNVLLDLGRARWDRGEDALPVLESALITFRQGIVLAPRFAPLHNAIGEVHRLRARYLTFAGQDPREDLAAAETAYGRAAEFIRHGAVFTNLGEVFLARAAYDIESGQAADSSLSRAREALEQARPLSERRAAFWRAMAERHLLAARLVQGRGGDPRQELESAARHLDRALSLDEDHVEALLTSARRSSRLAQWSLAQGLAVGETLNDGLKAVAKAYQSKPAEALVWRACLLVLSAEGASNPKDRTALARSAKMAFARAFDKNAHLEASWLTWLQKADAFLPP